MNLISCNNCGAVLDKNKITFPDLTRYTVPEADTVWSQDKLEYVAKVSCPVCDGDILDD